MSFTRRLLAAVSAVAAFGVGVGIGALPASAVIYYSGDNSCGSGYGCIGTYGSGGYLCHHGWNYNALADSGTLRSTDDYDYASCPGGTINGDAIDQVRNRNTASARSVYTLNGYLGTCYELVYDNRTWVNQNTSLDVVWNSFTVNSPGLYGCPNI